MYIYTYLFVVLLHIVETYLINCIFASPYGFCPLRDLDLDKKRRKNSKMPATQRKTCDDGGGVCP